MLHSTNRLNITPTNTNGIYCVINTMLKGYLRYKTILCHIVAPDVQLMNFFIWKKKMFRSQDIKIFMFLWNPQISKSVTSSQALLVNGSYTFAYFFWILSTIKMKFGRVLLCYMTNISNMCFWLNAEDWKLVPSSFLILLKWQYRKIWPFLMVEIYHF